MITLHCSWSSQHFDGCTVSFQRFVLQGGLAEDTHLFTQEQRDVSNFQCSSECSTSRSLCQDLNQQLPATSASGAHRSSYLFVSRRLRGEILFLNNLLVGYIRLFVTPSQDAVDRHAKYISVDGATAAVSSVNFSKTSFLMNREAGFVSFLCEVFALRLTEK